MKSIFFVLAMVVSGVVFAQQTMPDVSFETLSGSGKVSDFRGKVVYIDFWATWCGPCRAAQPSLTALSQRMEGKEVVILSLSLDQKRKKWKKMVKKHAPGGVHGWVGALNAPQELNIRFIPRYVLVDKQGNIVEMEAPAPAQADAAILNALAK